jgi:hypothetical protein
VLILLYPCTLHTSHRLALIRYKCQCKNATTNQSYHYHDYRLLHRLRSGKKRPALEAGLELAEKAGGCVECLFSLLGEYDAGSNIRPKLDLSFEVPIVNVLST